MNQQLPEKPTELAIDVEQWRSDIQTFAETTNRAIAAIAAELSNGCSGRRSERNITTRAGNPGQGTADKQIETKFAAPETFDPNDDPGNDRLAKLKQQLAQRIAKSE